MLRLLTLLLEPLSIKTLTLFLFFDDDNNNKFIMRLTKKRAFRSPSERLLFFPIFFKRRHFHSFLYVFEYVFWTPEIFLKFLPF